MVVGKELLRSFALGEASETMMWAPLWCWSLSSNDAVRSCQAETSFGQGNIRTEVPTLTILYLRYGVAVAVTMRTR